MQALPSNGHNLSQLSSLQALQLHDCGVWTQLPAVIFGLSTLTYLKVYAANNLEALPDGLSGLVKLKVLIIHECRKVSTVSPSISELTDLRELLLYNCDRLMGLPLDSLTSLQILDFRSNDPLKVRHLVRGFLMLDGAPHTHPGRGLCRKLCSAYTCV